MSKRTIYRYKAKFKKANSFEALNLKSIKLKNFRKSFVYKDIRLRHIYPNIVYVILKPWSLNNHTLLSQSTLGYSKG